MRLSLLLLCAFAAHAQNWEFGSGVGYGVLHNATISGPAGSAEAGIRNKYAVTGVIGENAFEHFSGEIRYLYHPGETFLSSGSASGEIDARTHTITYDVLAHLTPRKSRIRIFAAGGAGARYYDVTGAVPKPQPVPAIAGLTTRSQWKPAFNFGGGVKFRLSDHFNVRGDLRDYIALFPDKLFAPTGGAKIHGTLHQITPLIGIGISF